MRPAAPLNLSVNRYGLWRAGLLLLTANACATMLAWWWAQPVPRQPWVSAVAMIGALVSLACSAALWWTPPLTLRWDRQRWFVARDASAEQAGELAVAIDLGGWILLRFVPEIVPVGSPVRRSTMWIALQRRGLEPHWHGLRCALYCARPALPPGGGAADV